MTGQMYDHLALGAMDKTLTGTPSITFWRSVHKQPTRFSVASQSQPFNTSTQFGQESQCILNRVGDMVYHLYLHVVLPGLVACDSNSEQCAGMVAGNQFPVAMENGKACAPCRGMDEAALLEYLPDNYGDLSEDDQTAALKDAKDKWRKFNYGAAKELSCCNADAGDTPFETCPECGDTWAHWCNDVGHMLIKNCKLIIGGQQIDQIWGLMLFCWEELAGKSGRRLTELVGRRYTRSLLLCDATEEQEFFIPLPFWFTLATGSALPLAALAYHGVQINCDFADLSQLIVVSGNHVVVRNAKTNMALTASDLKADLEISYVFLDSNERDNFASKYFEMLIVQTQSYFKSESKAICRVPLSFNHPVQEIFWCVRRACQEKCNNWTNLSGIDGRDSIKDAELLLNTSSRFGKKSALYCRAVVPFEVHSQIPDSYVYVFSFSLTPESVENPAGSCNFSRLDHVELVLNMQPALANEQYTVYVYARSWNLMRFKEGVAGAAYQ